MEILVAFEGQNLLVTKAIARLMRRFYGKGQRVVLPRLLRFYFVKVFPLLWFNTECYGVAIPVCVCG